MWWPAGKGQDMHIDVMAKPLYEIPIETRKGTQLEFIEDEDEVINVVPYTDYASILYLNEDFEGGETEFLNGRKIKPETGKLVLFPSTWCMVHRGCPVTEGQKYLCVGWFYSTWNAGLDRMKNYYK